jgi:hypothetical protein
MMRTRNILLFGFLLIGLLALYLGLRNNAQAPVADGRPAQSPPAAETDSPAAALQQPSGSRVPPFHRDAESAKPYPRILPAEYFRGYPVVAQAYRIAASMPGILAQQPCYCWCDKFGHGSLLDCFASQHGAG